MGTSMHMISRRPTVSMTPQCMNRYTVVLALSQDETCRQCRYRVIAAIEEHFRNPDPSSLNDDKTSCDLRYVKTYEPMDTTIDTLDQDKCFLPRVSGHFLGFRESNRSPWTKTK